MEENKPEELSELEAQYEELKEDYEKLTDEKQMISSLLIDTENSLKKIKALKDNLQYEYDLQNFNQVIKEIEEDNCQKEIVSVDFLIRSCFLTAIKEYLEKHLIDEVASYGLGKNLIEFAKKDSKCLDLLKETYFKKINERLDDLYLSIKKHR